MDSSSVVLRVRRSKTVGRSDDGNYGQQAVCHWSGLENRDRVVSMGAVAGSYL